MIPDRKLTVKTEGERMYTAHDPISGPGFFAVKHTEIESDQIVEIPTLLQ